MNIGLSEDQLIDYVENKFKEITSSKRFEQKIIELYESADNNHGGECNNLKKLVIIGSLIAVGLLFHERF